MNVAVTYVCCVIVMMLTHPSTAIAFGGKSPCELLHDAYSRTAAGEVLAARAVSVYGHARRVLVLHDERAPSRAAAALLAAAAQHALRYSHLQLAHAPPHFCALAHLQQTDCHTVDSSSTYHDNVTIAPAIAWNSERCESAEVCRNNVDAPLRLEIVSKGVAPAALTVHARLAAATATVKQCLEAREWTFYQDQDKLIQCGFLRNYSSSVSLYTLAEWSNATIFTELKEYIYAASLQINIVLFDSDQGLRHHLLEQIQQQTTSFLFLDYDIWQEEADIYTVQPPPCVKDKCLTIHDPTRSLKVADVFILRQRAPELLALFRRFSPTTTQLREVLELSALNQDLNITDAACSWALNNSSTFQSWLPIDYTETYWIVVFLCNDDPDKNDYKKASELMKSMFSNLTEYYINIYYIEVDCADESNLSYELIKVTTSNRWLKLIGAVGASGGAQMAVEYAMIKETALILCEVPTSNTRLEPAARSVTGNIHQLVVAVRHFLTICKWSHLACISENTDLAKEFFETIKNDKIIKIHNIPLDNANIKPDNIKKHLQSLKHLNAKIIFVNTVPKIAEIILCKANDLEMTPSAGYAWILREWGSVDLNCKNSSVSAARMNHFTLSYWQRGQESKSINKNSSIFSIVHEKLHDIWNKKSWPPLTTPIMDALLLLVKSFQLFSQNYPERRDELHGANAVRFFLKSIEKEETSGFIQTFSYVNGTLKKPYIFVDQWYGQRREPIAKWQIIEERMHPVIEFRNIYANNPPTDGSHVCLTTSDGDAFKPHCHDYIWFTTVACLLLAFIALYISWKSRFKHLARRDSILMAQLSAQRTLVTTELADHFIDRAGLELYHDLGVGCFGRVRYGILRAPGRPIVSVAVKELREDVPQTEEQELLREAITLSTLSHDHVVRLIGVCTSDGPLFVLMEYAFFGNLRVYLSERRHLADRAVALNIDDFDEAFHVSATALTRLAKEAASALEYLALQRLVHRDVRASNCLVDARRSLKLADFGLARKTGTGASGDEEEYLCRRRGLFPVLWMAPESLERGVFTAASDAWALGVLLLELLTLGARPYACWPPLRVLRYVAAGGRPPTPADLAPAARLVLLGCWQRAADARWSAAAVRRELARDPALLRPALLPPLMPDDDTAINTDDANMFAEAIV